MLSSAALSAVALACPGTASAAGAFHTTGAVNVRSGPGTGYGVTGSAGANASFVLLCQWQGGTNVGGNSTWDYVQFTTGFTGAIADYLTSTPSWNSFAPGTGSCSGTAPVAPAPAPPAPAPAPPSSSSSVQMQNAARWAVAEKNSPDPTWSDHYRQAWSGWCERFAEQAEGFSFHFASALANYNSQKAQGRIHTDANPPVGALVYYSGGTNGHVAVSIGGGQAVGTYGNYGQRLPVRQYPVVGYLSNPYLGWARPIGS